LLFTEFLVCCWHGYAAAWANQYIMSFNPGEQVSQLFIEGPRQPIEERYTEKVAHHADLAKGHEDEDVNTSIYDNNRPFNDPNERSD
jgi:hypothetical protein